MHPCLYVSYAVLKSVKTFCFGTLDGKPEAEIGLLVISICMKEYPMISGNIT